MLVTSVMSAQLKSGPATAVAREPIVEMWRLLGVVLIEPARRSAPARGRARQPWRNQRGSPCRSRVRRAAPTPSRAPRDPAEKGAGGALEAARSPSSRRGTSCVELEDGDEPMDFARIPACGARLRRSTGTKDLEALLLEEDGGGGLPWVRVP
jgi:hypothetical protein